MGRRAAVVLPSIRRHARPTLRRAGRLAAAPVRAGLVDLHGLPRGSQILLVFAYTAVLLCLGFAMLLELRPDLAARLPSLQSPILTTQPQFEMRYVPASGPLWWLPAPLGVMMGWHFYASVPLLLMATIACFIGWGLVLTGASDCGRRVFLPIAVLFALHLQVMLAYLGSPSSLGILSIGGEFVALSAQSTPVLRVAYQVMALLLVAVPVGLHLRTHRSRHWRDHPILELVGWTLIAPAIILLITFTLPDLFWWVRVGVPFPLAVQFTYLSAIGGAWMGMLLVVYLAVDTVNLALELGQGAADGLQRRLTEMAFLRVSGALVVLAGALGLIGLLFGFGPEDLRSIGPIYFMIVLVLPPMPLAVWVIWRMSRHGWTAPVASAALGLAGGWVAWAAALLLALSTLGQDFLGFVVSAPGLIPPGTLFILLLLYGVLTFGARYANAEGGQMPRAGRGLLFLGVVMLILSTLLYVSATRNEALQAINDALTLVALIFLAPAYFAWTLVRRILKARRAVLPT